MFEYHWKSNRSQSLYTASLILAAFALYGVLHWHFLPMLFASMLTLSQSRELILAMTVAASVLGIGGVVLAPIAYAYIKEELRCANII